MDEHEHGVEAGQPLPPRLTARLIIVFYGLMIGLALLLGWLFDVPSLFHLPGGAKLLPEGPLSWGAGIALGLVAHGLGELARRRFEWAQSFHQRMAELLGPVSHPWVVVAAASSGFAEELLFRGALLPITGLWFQAFLFGLVHVGPDRSMRFWPYYAAVMGVLFGVLYQQSGSLLPPVLAHFTVNYFGLSVLIRDRASGPAP
ncbi:MAG: type II CAAX endopeptidase family protein [Deltaproteobacteria bacterium]|nr:type II CAAX endopeptidase family protein [Deltaproteobacteria bacterium]